MSSATDELRTWAAERVPIVRRQIEKIADNIDAEFERVAQAVDDTLGPETCRFEFDQKASDRCQGPVYSCDKCGALSYIDETDKGKFKFCPNCGSAVKR